MHSELVRIRKNDDRVFHRHIFGFAITENKDEVNGAKYDERQDQFVCMWAQHYSQVQSGTEFDSFFNIVTKQCKNLLD